VSRARPVATMKAAHDPMFTTDVRRAFCARLRDCGLDYGTLADELGRLDVPRPSAGSGTWRALIVATARLSSGDALRCAETAARLYDARRHSQSAPPPADNDGYLASLTDAPALCAAPGRALAACCATTTTTSETCALVWSVCVVEYRASDCSDPAGGDL